MKKNRDETVYQATGQVVPEKCECCGEEAKYGYDDLWFCKDCWIEQLNNDDHYDHDARAEDPERDEEPY